MHRDPVCGDPGRGGEVVNAMTPGPAVDLIEHAARIIIASRKQPYTAPAHWAGALWEAGMLVAPGSALQVAAPAGDGGLREALEQKLATTDGWAVANETLLAMLAAHPAAPAVPQPVDREALIQALANEVRSWPDAASLPHHPDDAKVVLTFARLADAVLAVLAGEQEQARG